MKQEDLVIVSKLLLVNKLQIVANAKFSSLKLLIYEPYYLP
jgi:hypothetical protein